MSIEQGRSKGMSEIERDGLSAREMFLMREAMSAGTYYESLEQWLDEQISDAGHYVAQHLAHDAERLYGQARGQCDGGEDEPVGVIELSDYVQLDDSDFVPRRKALTETKTGSVQNLPVGTKLYTHPPAANQGVPEGWKLLPLELTAGQLKAVWDYNGIYPDEVAPVYDLLLNNAPNPPQQQEKGDE